jgi:membrane protein DedA with SNARE-associated domain
MNVTHIINGYGYWAVFLFVAVESLGIPVPGETVLIAAGAYAGHTHRLSAWLIFAVATAGAIVGDNIGFWAGDKGGYRCALKYGDRVRLDERKLMIGRYVFDAYGTKVVFFGRFVSILRTYAAFLAGTSKMRWRRFWPANAAGGIVWAGIFTLVAYEAGNALIHLSGTIDVALGAVALLAGAIGLLVTRRHIGTLAARAEEAYTTHGHDHRPGPAERPAPTAAPVRASGER